MRTFCRSTVGKVKIVNCPLQYYFLAVWLNIIVTISDNGRVCVSTEQDRGLDQLSLALRRQREVGLTIQEEVEEQNCKNDLGLPRNDQYNHL